MEEKALYFECASGISGDMAAGALIDLGADREALGRALASIPDPSFRVGIETVTRASIAATDFSVQLDEEHETRDHDMEYLYGHLHHAPAASPVDERHDPHHGHGHEHAGHDHEHGHEHDPGQHDPDHEHGPAHRHLSDIYGILDQVDMTDSARTLAKLIFRIVAESEAKAHAQDVENVHFHEVGAIDSIVDIVAVSVCFDSLGIRRVIVPALTEGTGTVRSQHGILPVPVPSVVNICSACGLTLQPSHMQGEFVTPTGAAIAGALKTDDALPPRYQIEKIGIGAGKREYPTANILRVMLLRVPVQEKQPRSSEGASGSGQPPFPEPENAVWTLETNVDDSTGEQLGFVLEELLRAGAREAYFTPIYMKKNRPGTLLTVLCDAEKIPAMEALLFRHTTTIGIRRYPVWRTALPRRIERVDTPYGSIRVKISEYLGTLRFAPEYDDVAQAARTSRTEFGRVYAAAKDRAEESFGQDE